MATNEIISSESLANTMMDDIGDLKRVRFLVSWTKGAKGMIWLSDVSLGDGCHDLDPSLCPTDRGVCKNGRKAIFEEDVIEPNEYFCHCNYVSRLSTIILYFHTEYPIVQGLRG